MQGKSSLSAFRTRLKHMYNVSTGILCACLFTSNRTLYPPTNTSSSSHSSAIQKVASFVSPQSSTQPACILGLVLSKCQQCQSNSSFQRSSIQAPYFVVLLFFPSCSQPRKYLPSTYMFINCKMVFCVPPPRFHSLMLIN